MTDKHGYIYVLTNTSFPEYVKIGYADNVDERVAQLNRSECTPFAFKKYAVLGVTSRLADKNVHKLIDKFKPELRAKENVNGKMRIREFFAMSAKEAVEILDMIGSIYGETPQIFVQTAEEKREQEIAEKTAVASERRSPFSFYKCGIQNGAVVGYIYDSNITCTVVGDREVLYNGEKTSLSSLAKKLLKSKFGVQGTRYFTYNGEVLSALRKRLEDEGNYVNREDNNEVDESNRQNTESNDSKDVLLTFATQKYDAKCKWNQDGYLLLKGSKVATTVGKSCPLAIKRMREDYAKYINDEFVLTKDILFESSSAAAKFVTGSSVNGKICWKNQDGVLLEDLL